MITVITTENKPNLTINITTFMRASLLAYSNKNIIEVQRYCKNLRSTIFFAFFSREVWWSKKMGSAEP